MAGAVVVVVVVVVVTGLLSSNTVMSGDEGGFCGANSVAGATWS